MPTTTTEEQDVLKCADCLEELTSEDYVDNNGDPICEDCNDDYNSCCGCSDVLHNDDVYYAQDDPWCHDCYVDRFSICDDCQETVRNDDTCEVHGRSGSERYVCDGCRQDYFWCENCDEYVHEDNYCQDDLCNDCYNDRYGDDDDDGSSSNKEIIRSYNYKPIPKFYKVSENDNVYLGIELEVERGDSSITHRAMAEMVNNDFLYFKSDGSLSNGFEIVTHPMTISYIKKHKNVWADILNELRSNKYRSYDTRTCGMHIHISKNAFTTWHLYRFMKFFVDNSDFVTKISQRKIENLDRWAALTDDPSESTKEYTQETLMYKAKKKRGNSKRYLAVNLQNDNSVEVRIFRGTLNDSSFFKNIEFVQALYDYTKSIPDSDMSLKSFLTFIKDNNEYPYLRKFIADKNINPFTNQNKTN
jgi:L-rhamnose mutarotase